MTYRELGQTGLKLSVVSYGAASIGNEYGNLDEAQGIRSLHVALDGGVNFIDTSPYYGRTLSEKVLGKAFKEIPRDRFIIGTKCGRYDVDRFDFTAERVTRSVDESLQRMGLDLLDIIQCHDIEFGVDIASLAIRFCVENSEFTTTVAGTANPVNMANILKWIESPLDHELLKDVQEILEPARNVLWPVGRPENSERYEAGL
jgi:aryl-alcohol dehydrogenase-like predicted oxidoreductase